MTIGTSEFFNFINQNLHSDPFKLSLSAKKDNFPFDFDFAILQIECRKKCSDKLSDFLDFPEFLFPDRLSAEQASHQAVAKYHDSLISPGSSVLDMTAGLGIDSLTFALNGKSVTSIELNSEKAKTLQNNILTLGLSTIKAIESDSIEFLKNQESRFDVIFIDPSRRDSEKNRVYNFHDCSPDIITNLDLILSGANKVLIKASPLLDVTQTIKDLKKVKSIRAVGVKGECKELLIELSNEIKDNEEPILLEAIDLNTEGTVLSSFSDFFTLETRHSIQSDNIIDKTYDPIKTADLIGKYLLEPSAMIMKFSPWDTIARRFQATKLGKSSHLFVSETLPQYFPGRVTKIEKVITNKDRKSLKGFPASVVSRNYPLSSETIRKEYGLKESDQNFIYATRIGDKPIMLLTNKI